MESELKINADMRDVEQVQTRFIAFAFTWNVFKDRQQITQSVKIHQL